MTLVSHPDSHPPGSTPTIFPLSHLNSPFPLSGRALIPLLVTFSDFHLCEALNCSPASGTRLTLAWHFHHGADIKGKLISVIIDHVTWSVHFDDLDTDRKLAQI